VLFSEPKIPQFINRHWNAALSDGFSALQRAENSSIFNKLDVVAEHYPCFSALQRAENSSIRLPLCVTSSPARVSVLFSEPKIPQ